MQFQRKKNKRGFTLIELLVVIAIIGIMTGVMIVSMGRGRDQRAVDVSARQVAATLRMAQGYAVAGRYEGNGNIPCTFYFFANSATGKYGVRYTYHAKNSSSCSGSKELASYSVTNGVGIATSRSIAFDVLQGAVDAPAIITLRKGNVTKNICVSGVGRIEEGC